MWVKYKCRRCSKDSFAEISKKVPQRQADCWGCRAKNWVELRRDGSLKVYHGVIGDPVSDQELHAFIRNNEACQRVAENVLKNLSDGMNEALCGGIAPSEEAPLSMFDMIAAFNSCCVEVRPVGYVERGKCYITDRNKIKERDPMLDALSADEPGQVVWCHPDDKEAVESAIGSGRKAIPLPLKEKMGRAAQADVHGFAKVLRMAFTDEELRDMMPKAPDFGDSDHGLSVYYTFLAKDWIPFGGI